MIKPPQSAIAHLKANPHLHAHFDRKYGKGAASDHIGPIPIRFVMCPPKYLSTRIKNNKWMEGKTINIPRAMQQFNRIVTVIEALGTKVLQIPPVPAAQDQVYTANIGIALKPYIILSKYKSPGRQVEVPPARRFFEQMGYKCIECPYYFEGRADLIKFNDTTYIGGIGQSSDPEAYKWIEDKTGVNVVNIKETDKGLFHCDCVVFVINDQNILVNTEGTDAAGLKQLEKLANVIPVPKGLAETGITNSVKIPNKPIVLSGCFKPETPEHRKAMDALNVLYDKFGMTVVLLDCDEFDKSGADLSCCVMDLDF